MAKKVLRPGLGRRSILTKFKAKAGATYRGGNKTVQIPPFCPSCEAPFVTGDNLLQSLLVVRSFTGNITQGSFVDNQALHPPGEAPVGVMNYSCRVCSSWSVPRISFD